MDESIITQYVLQARVVSELIANTFVASSYKALAQCFTPSEVLHHVMLSVIWHKASSEHQGNKYPSHTRHCMPFHPPQFGTV